MKTLNEKFSHPFFNVIADTGRSLAFALARRTSSPATLTDPDEENEIEEVRQQRDAFKANPRTAAGRRMMFFLERSGSRAIGHGPHKEEHRRKTEDKVTRTAMAFLIVTEAQQTYRESMLAGLALTQMISDYSQQRDILRSLLDNDMHRQRALSSRIVSTESELHAVAQEKATTERSAHKINEDIDELDSWFEETSENSFRHYSGIAALENRSIKIVRPGMSICELRKSLSSEETQAPEIYITTGRNDADGTPIYDKLTHNDDGSLKIVSVSAAEAGDIVKDTEDGMYTDLYERVFYEPAAEGNGHFMRMEHGINGELMGEIGSISRTMLQEYMAATGKRADDITTDAGEYRDEVIAQQRLIDKTIKLQSIIGEKKDYYSEARETIERRKKDYDLHKRTLSTLKEQSAACGRHMSSLRDAISRADLVIDHAMNTRTRLNKLEVAGLESIAGIVPDFMRGEFIRHYNTVENSYVREWAPHGITRPEENLGRAWMVAGNPVPDFLMADVIGGAPRNGPWQHFILNS